MEKKNRIFSFMMAMFVAIFAIFAAGFFLIENDGYSGEVVEENAINLTSVKDTISGDFFEIIIIVVLLVALVKILQRIADRL